MPPLTGPGGALHPLKRLLCVGSLYVYIPSSLPFRKVSPDSLHDACWKVTCVFLMITSLFLGNRLYKLTFSIKAPTSRQGQRRQLCAVLWRFLPRTTLYNLETKVISKTDLYLTHEIVIYRVFIKYCVFPYNFVIFLNSASSKHSQHDPLQQDFLLSRKKKYLDKV